MRWNKLVLWSSKLMNKMRRNKLVILSSKLMTKMERLYANELTVLAPNATK